MPLHKSRGSRLDPTMISAPLGDFRHTMHIGRGGDAFGDTSFLSSHGPPPAEEPPPSPPPPAPPVRRPGSGSSLSLELDLDLDLDLGPSILGDVLGVMDGRGRGEQGAGGPGGPAPEAPEEEELQAGAKGLGLEGEGLGTRWEGLVPEGEELGSRKSGESQGRGAGPGAPEEVGRPKGAGPRPKVRFSDKREEITGPEEAGEELEPEGEGLQSAEAGLVSRGGGESPGPMGREGAGATGDRHTAEKTEGEEEEEEEEEEGETVGGIRERVLDPDRHPPPGPTHPAHRSPSPASSTSSEYEGVTPLDRRREALDQSETESEEGEGTGQGYTFEEEFDDEIGL